MNYSFEYIDIILLAMIAGFIFLRLRGILGKRSGFEGKSPPQFQEVINKIYNGLNTGGAFIFSEKTFSCNPRVQDMMTFMYYDYKRQNFSDKEILDKEVQLRHMMKPNTKTELYNMVQDAGFEIHTFWQNFNFVGVIALKK